MNVAVRAAGEHAPKSQAAEQDEQRAADPFRAGRHRDWNGDAESDGRHRTDAEHGRVAACKSDRRSHDAPALSRGRSPDGERGDRHQMIAAETVEKPERQG
jgi:hypothetical protein